jgi:hypothetical protein
VLYDTAGVASSQEDSAVCYHPPKDERSGLAEIDDNRRPAIFACLNMTDQRCGPRLAIRHCDQQDEKEKKKTDEGDVEQNSLRCTVTYL